MPINVGCIDPVLKFIEPPTNGLAGTIHRGRRRCKRIVYDCFVHNQVTLPGRYRTQVGSRLAVNYVITAAKRLPLPIPLGRHRRAGFFTVACALDHACGPDPDAKCRVLVPGTTRLNKAMCCC